MKKVFRRLALLSALPLKWILQGILATCTLNIRGRDSLGAISPPHAGMLLLWHRYLAILPAVLSKITSNVDFTAVVSSSADGEILSRVIGAYPRGHTIRVDSEGKHQALRHILQEIKKGTSVVVITPDGPRGPAEQLKVGVAFAAKHTSAPMVAVVWRASRFWQLNSWDRMQIPKPFSTIDVVFAPIPPLHGSTVEELRNEIERHLRQISSEATVS